MSGDQVAGERRTEDLVERELLLREGEPRRRAGKRRDGKSASDCHARKIRMGAETGKTAAWRETAHGPDGAGRVADQVNALIDQSPRVRLLHVTQIRASVQAIAANISEGLGRRPGRDRARSFEIARGETEETITHLSANFRTDRISTRKYWPIHNRLVVIVKMVDSFLRE